MGFAAAQDPAHSDRLPEQNNGGNTAQVSLSIDNDFHTGGNRSLEVDIGQGYEDSREEAQEADHIKEFGSLSDSNEASPVVELGHHGGERYEPEDYRGQLQDPADFLDLDYKLHEHQALDDPELLEREIELIKSDRVSFTSRSGDALE